MDSHTLDLLEFDKIRALVASYAACSLGKDAAHRLEPRDDLEWIHHQQALTTEMTEVLAADLTPPFGGLHDIRPLVRRAQTGATLTADELAATVETLRAIANLARWLDRIGGEFPRLGGLRQGVGEFLGLTTAIEGCIDPRGKVLDTASRKLSAVRREIGQYEEKIQAILRAMLRSPEMRRVLRYPSFTMVGHHYVLPVAKEFRGEVQGSVQRTSASNETVFIEPQAIAEQSAQLSYLRAREAKEIKRILRWLSAQVGQEADALLATIDELAELDLTFAKGRYSLDYAMASPDFNREGRMVLRGARHPLLEALFRARKADPPAPPGPEPGPGTPAEEGENALAPAPAPEPPRKVVPIDLHLGLQFQILAITGPNTGGKTVALKTAGLLAVMAQSGLHIPAHQGSRLPLFDRVLADIGDEQSLEQSLSTFSSHMRRVAEILATATESSLVLLDELGAGTDPVEGAALARSILDELDSIGCRALVTTHLGELKSYAFANPRVENAAVGFDLETLRPTFRLHIGEAGQSNALQIARRLRLPEHLVARAESYLAANQGHRVQEWELIQRLRHEAEQARQEALAAQAEAERARDLHKQRLIDLNRQAEADARLEEARARLQPGDRVVVPRFGYDRPGRIVKLDLRKKQAVVAIGQMQWDVAIAELVPQLPRGPEVASPAAGRTGPNRPALPRLPTVPEADDE